MIYSRLNNYLDMKSLIIAREKEQAMLDRLLTEPTSQLLTIYGHVYRIEVKNSNGSSYYVYSNFPSSEYFGVPCDLNIGGD